MTKKSDLPRFVITIADTKTIIDRGKGDEYLSLSAASGSLQDFIRPYTEEQKKKAHIGCDNELEAMFAYFKEDIKDAKSKDKQNG